MNKREKSLGRTIQIASLAAILTASVIVGVNGFSIYFRGMMNRYETYLTSVLNLAMTEIDGDDLRMCMETGTKSEAFEQTQYFLNRVRETYDIQYIYIVKPLNTNDIDNMMNVMAGVTAAEIEENEEFYTVELGETTGTDYSPAVAAKYLEGMDADGITFFRNTTEYGDDYTGQIRICDSAGNPVALLAADVSIGELRTTFRTFVFVMAVENIILILLMMLFIFRWLKGRVIEPTQRLVRTSKYFVESSRMADDPSRLVVKDPDIHTGDEMEAVSAALMDMFTDMKRYMSDLVSVTREKERIGAELSVATAIQSDMLPRIFPPFPNRSEFALYAAMNPAKEVGGDFYDFFLVDEDHLALVIADVSGKGVPAALFMVITKTLIKNRLQMGDTPQEAARHVNNQLCDGNEESMFVTVWMAVLEISTGKGAAVNAGHEHPAILRKGGAYELAVYQHDIMFAIMEDYPFSQHEFELHPGDSLFVYTDGVAEAMNVKNEQFGTDRMLEALNRQIEVPPQVLLGNVREAIDAFAGKADQFDDITMLCIQYKGKEMKADEGIDAPGKR